jgi:hypothetical protein
MCNASGAHLLGVLAFQGLNPEISAVVSPNGIIDTTGVWAKGGMAGKQVKRM